MCDLLHTLKLFKWNKVCFFLHVSNVLGMCRGMCMRSHASYAKACYRADDPNNRKQGGVCIYYKESLGVTELKLSNLVNVLFMKSPCNRFAKNISKVVGNNLGLEILVQFDRDQLVSTHYLLKWNKFWVTLRWWQWKDWKCPMWHAFCISINSRIEERDWSCYLVIFYVAK